MKTARECPESVPRWKFQRDAARNRPKPAPRARPVPAAKPARVPYDGPRHQRMESARHRGVVDHLLTLGLVEGGFADAVRSAVGQPFDGSPLMWPDAYRVSSERRLVDICEVIVAHPIDAHKAAKIAAWATWLTSHGWTLRLFKLDCHGSCVEHDPYTLRMTPAEWAKVVAAVNSLDRPLPITTPPKDSTP